MKNSSDEVEAKKRNHDERRGPSTSKTTVINRSKVNPESSQNVISKKTKYDKLWIPKNTHTSSSRSSTKPKVKSTPSPSGTNLNCLKRSRESKKEKEAKKVTDSESSYNTVPSIQKIDASTQTVRFVTVDATISCVCEIADRSTGSNIPIEYRCSTKSVQTTDQSDQRILSKPEVNKDESRDSRNREEFLLTTRSNKRFTIEPETSWADESDLIYDEDFHSDKNFVDKPKYVATCESFGQSTDKSLSISHDFFDAAVGSSIIIEENGKNVSTATEKSHEEIMRKSVHCEVCTACRELYRGPSIFETTGEPSKFECSSCMNDRQIRDDRNRKKHSFSMNSENRDDQSDEFITNPQNFSESIISKSNRRKDSREKLARQGRMSGEMKPSRSSKNYRDSNESPSFWHDNVKVRNNNEPRVLKPLHESSRLNVESINDFHRDALTFPESHGTKPRNNEIKLAGTLSRSNKNYPEEREINVRTCDFDEVILRRRYKPCSQDIFRSREKGNAQKYQIVDKLEPLSKKDSDNALTFNLKEFEQPTYKKNQYPKNLSGCKFSEINNFGKIYDWDRPMDRIVDEILRCETSKRQKAWKSSDGSVPRNKCPCHN